MELKRNYREVYSLGSFIVKKNSFLRRNFSLTGLYYHLGHYGEDLFRPIIFGVTIIVLSTFFWLTHLDTTNFQSSFRIDDVIKLSTAFQRSIVDFLPLPNLGNQAS